MSVRLRELFSWYGVIAILLAYVGVSFEVLQPDSVLFQLLNLSGALGIAIDAYLVKNYQPAVLNFVWAAIALVALVSVVL